MKKIRFLFETLLFIPLTLCGQSNYFEYLSVKDGLSDYSINSLYEDEYARMWIATRNGLNYYDGQQFHLAQLANNAYDTYVRQVTGDHVGHLLIQTRTETLLMNLYNEHFTTLRRGPVSTIAGQNNKLWIVASDTLFQVAVEDSVELKYILHAEGLRTIASVDDHSFWIAEKKGVQLFRNNMPIISFPHLQHVAQMMLDSRQNLWVCTQENGLYLINPQYNITHYSAQQNTPYTLTDNDVRCITEDKAGNYWIGLYGGLCHLDWAKGKIRQYEYDPRAEHALSTFSVRALVTDQQGTIWIGTFFGGIDLINPQYSPYIYYGAYGKKGHHLTNPIVTGSCNDQYGNLWIATNGGGLNYIDFNNNLIDYIPIDNKEPQNAIKSLWLDSTHHRLWIATHRGGLLSMNTRTHRIEPYPLPERNMRQLIGEKDTLWVLTQHNIYAINLNTLTYRPGIPRHLMPSVRGELSDMTRIKNQLWFAYTNHLYCYSNQHIASFFFDANITTLCADRNHHLLIGTDTRGVWHQTDKGLEPLTAVNQHLPSCYITDIVTHNNEYIVSTNSSVTIFNSDWQPISSFTTTGGLPLEVIVEHSTAVYDNMIFVGGVNGLVLCPLHSTSSDVQPTALHISSVLVDNQRPNLNCSYPFLQTITLTPGNHTLSIQATTSGIVTRRNSHIRYRLKNYDHDWIVTDNTALINYTNLPKGKYTLEIECLGTDFHREITIQVQPYWYDSWWAWAFYLLLGCAAVVIALTYFEQYIEQKTRQQLNKGHQQELQKITNIVMNHLADDTFNVQQFAKEMYISRTGLYTKLQEVTGQTPNDFILSIRMREAATLLRTEHTMSILEISERVGFNSASYFIKCFHRFYGKSPSSWRQTTISRDK